MTRDENRLELRVEVREGYVFVWQKGLVETQAELEDVQRQIGDALNRAGTKMAMFDNRLTERPEEWIRASMWTWLTENIRRAALLQQSPRNLARADRTAQRNRISVRAFHDEAEAEAWLLGRPEP